MKTLAHLRKLAVLMCCICQVAVSCSGQNKNNTADIHLNPKPNIRYKVNREHDKNGNLIRYDSSYSYSFHGEMNDSLAEKMLWQFHSGFFPHQDGLEILNDTLMFRDPAKEFFNDFFNDHEWLLHDFKKGMMEKEQWQVPSKGSHSGKEPRSKEI